MGTGRATSLIYILFSYILIFFSYVPFRLHEQDNKLVSNAISFCMFFCKVSSDFEYSLWSPWDAPALRTRRHYFVATEMTPSLGALDGSLL